METYGALCWLDFLEMFGYLFFAAELSLTLRTFVTCVLHCFCFLSYCLMSLGCCLWVGLA